MAIFAYIDGYCPACGASRLIVRNGEKVAAEDDRKVRCGNRDCPDPLAAHKILSDPEIEHILEVLPDVPTEESGRWTLKHPLRERIDGDLFDCALARYLTQRFAFHYPPEPGRYRVRHASEHNLDANWVFEKLTS